MELALSKHTYTAKSHENLLKQFTKTLHEQDEVPTLKKEINQLKVDIKKANMEIKLKEDRINALETMLLTNVPNPIEHLMVQKDSVYLKEGRKCNSPKGLAFGDSANTLTHHFSEVMKRHQDTLERKDKEIRKLEALLAQYEQRQETVHQERIIRQQDFVKNQYETGENMNGTCEYIKSRIENQNENSVIMDQSYGKSPLENQYETGQNMNESCEYIKSPMANQNNSSVIMDGQCEYSNPPAENQYESGDIGDGSYGQGKYPFENQYESGDIGDGTCGQGKYPFENQYETGDHMGKTLHTKDFETNHAPISDIERIGQYFTEKLDLEQELDILYWQIEQKRYLMFQNNTEYDYDQRRAYEKEFETFKKTRDTLLGNLGKMKDRYNKDATAKLLENHAVHENRFEENHQHI